MSRPRISAFVQTATLFKAVLDDRGFSRVTRDELDRMARECGALDEARGRAER